MVCGRKQVNRMPYVIARTTQDLGHHPTTTTTTYSYSYYDSLPPPPYIRCIRHTAIRRHSSASTINPFPPSSSLPVTFLSLLRFLPIIACTAAPPVSRSIVSTGGPWIVRSANNKRLASALPPANTPASKSALGKDPFYFSPATGLPHFTSCDSPDLLSLCVSAVCAALSLCSGLFLRCVGLLLCSLSEAPGLLPPL